MPGVHVVAEATSMANLRGKAVIGSTLRTFNQQLNRGREVGLNGRAGGTLRKNYSARTAQ